MEDTCYILRPDIVLKIDRSQNPRPALVSLLVLLAVSCCWQSQSSFLETPFFIHSIHSLVIFCPQILNLANNHAVYMGSIRIRRKWFGHTPQGPHAMRAIKSDSEAPASTFGATSPRRVSCDVMLRRRRGYTGRLHCTVVSCNGVALLQRRRLIV